MYWKGNNYVAYLELEDALSNIKDKIAAFDVDWTLIRSEKRHPKNTFDWEYLYEWVPETLEELSKTHTIVCFSNQTLLKKPDRKEMIKERLLSFAESLEIPIIVYVSFADTVFRKPCLGMVDLFLEQSGKSIEDIEFYVGDAAGRQFTKTKKDFSDSDLRFAKNIGTQFHTPEDYFGDGSRAEPQLVGYVPDKQCTKVESRKFRYSFPKEPHAIIMMGYPGSGKSTFVKKHLSDYKVFEFDKIPRSKIKLPVDDKGNLTQSIVFDGVHMTKSQRDRTFGYLSDIDNLRVYCIFLDMTMEEAIHRDKYRINKTFYESDKPVLKRPIMQRIPKIAYRIARKNFEPPSKKEGFTDIIKYCHNIDDKLYWQL